MADHARRLACHHCGSVNLCLTETHDEHGQSDDGLIVDKDGHLRPIGPFYFMPGDPGRKTITCESCKRTWVPRRYLDSQWGDFDTDILGDDRG